MSAATGVALVGDADVGVLQVYQWGLLVAAEEVVLAIIVDPLEGLDTAVVELCRAEVGRTLLPTAQVLLEQ